MIKYKIEMLQNYLSYLSNLKCKTIDNIERIRSIFHSFDWSDNVYLLAKNDMNEHIAILNDLLAEIDRAEKFIEEIINETHKYLKLATYQVE